MTVIISKSVFGLNGSAQSSQDMIRSILSVKGSLTVISLQDIDYSKLDFIDENNRSRLKWLVFHYPPSLDEVFKSQNLKKILKQFYWMIKYPIWRRSFNKRIKEANFKHLILNNIGSRDIFEQIPVDEKTKKTLLLRVSPELASIKGDSDNRDLSALFSRFENYIFVSSTVRDKWIDTLKLDRAKTYYIPNTIRENISLDLMKWKPDELKDACGFSKEKVSIFCLASMQYHKGQDLLIDAVEKIWKLGRSDFELILMGGVNEDSKQLYNRIKELASAYPIRHIVSAPPELAMKHMAACDIFILPSRSEAMPRAVLEAMSLKRTIIGSDVGGIPELIENEEDGLIFSSGNSAELQGCIEKLLNNRELAFAYSESAHKKYWEQFSQDVNRNNWKKFFES